MIRRPRSRLAFSLASALLLVTISGGVALGAGRAAFSSVTSHAFPSTSCKGLQACDGVTGTVGANSCNGDLACTGAAGNVGNNSCNGHQACDTALRDVDDNSCNGEGACSFTTGNVGHNSCNGDWTCFGATGNVGHNSCNIYYACGGATGNVGYRSCNGNSACAYATGHVGNGSCAGRVSCFFARGPIGNHACNGNSTCKNAGRVHNCARNVPRHVPTPCTWTRSVMGSSSVPATAGQPVRLWATVFARHPVVGKPGGRFRFRIDGKTLPHDVAIDRYGRASLTRAFRPGVHWVSGRYLGDGTFAESIPVAMYLLVVK